MSGPANDWLTLDELAEWLQVPRATLHQWRYKRKGPMAYRLGRSLRFRREDVEAWLEEQRDDRRGFTQVDGVAS